jgi:hypothetical protein
VPGGWLLRERTYVVLGAMLAAVGAASFVKRHEKSSSSSSSSSSSTSSSSSAAHHRRREPWVVLGLLALALLVVHCTKFAKR